MADPPKESLSKEDADRLASQHEAALARIAESAGEEQAKVKKIIVVTSALCAAIAVQPIPFADLVILTPIQLAMGYQIGRAKRIDVSKQRAGTMLKEVAGVLAMGIAAQQGIIALYKIGLPGLGGAMTIPLVFGATYAIGEAMAYYWDCVRAQRPFDPAEMKRIFKETMGVGRDLGKQQKKDIQRQARSMERERDSKA